jgi:hypothetical protein
VISSEAVDKAQAAICHLNAHEFARAAQIVRKGDEDGYEAGTWYILFLVAVEQGVEDEGVWFSEASPV